MKYGVLKTLYAGLGEDGEAQKNEVLYERAKSKAKAREMENAGVVQAVQYQDY